MSREPFVLLGGLALLVAAQSTAQSAADQVIARVGDDKITRAQLAFELPKSVTDPLLQAVGLQALVSRKLLVQEARRQGLDKTPVGAMLMKRFQEEAIAALVEQQLAGPPPAIADGQVRAFVAANPLMFGQRRLIFLDQMVIEDADSGLAKRLQPANSMQEFEDILLHDHVAYSQSSTVLDTLTLDAKSAGQLAALRVGEVFITPRPGNTLELSVVTENRMEPIAGPQAERMARLLLSKRAQEGKARAEVAKIVKAHEDDVRINPDFEPKGK